MKRHAIMVLVALAVVAGGEIRRWRSAGRTLLPPVAAVSADDHALVVRLHDARDILEAMIAFQLQCTPAGYARSTDSKWADSRLKEMLDHQVYPIRMGASRGEEVPYSVDCRHGWVFMQATTAEHHAVEQALALVPLALRDAPANGAVVALGAEQLAGYQAPPKGGDPLDQVVPEFHVAALPREEALRQWSRQSGVPVEVRWKTRADAAEPVTLHMRGAASWRVLDHLLRHSWCMYRLHGRTVVVSPDEPRPVELRVYDTRDLSRQLLSYTFQELATERARSRYVLAGELALPYPGWFEGIAPGWHADDEAGRLLADLIESSIERDSWSSNGGNAPFGYIGGLLLIGNTRDAHEQIERLLNQLRTESRGEDSEGRP